MKSYYEKVFLNNIKSEEHFISVLASIMSVTEAGLAGHAAAMLHARLGSICLCNRHFVNLDKFGLSLDECKNTKECGKLIS